MSCHIHQWKKRSCQSQISNQLTMLVGQRVEAIEPVFTHVYYIPWQTNMMSGSNPSLFFEASIIDIGLELSIINRTTNELVSQMSVLSSGFYTMSFVSPTENSRLEILIRRIGQGTNPSIYGLGLVIN